MPGGLAQLADLVDSKNGFVSARIFADQQLYERELETVFGDSWLFVAHESEVPHPGDFVTRYMGEDPVIVCRGRDDQVRVLLNVCRHRGRKLCLEDAGNIRTFQCAYHGWTYNEAGELTGVPFFDAYQGKLDKASLGLHQAARVETCFGLIFATWSDCAPPLSGYIGEELAWMMRILFDRTAHVEVAGPPMRWTVDANWKLGAANFSGDGHHLPTTHGYGAALGLDASRGHRIGYVLHTDEGHCSQMRYCPPGTIDTPPYLGLPEALWPEVDARLSPEQLDVMNSHLSYSGNIFPNLSFLCVATVGFLNTEWQPETADRPVVSFLTIRQWQPRGPDGMEVWSWQLLDRDVPESWKEASRVCYERAFGMAGLHEQDDVENWAAITEAVRSPRARQLRLNYQMCMEATPAPDWRGPASAYASPSFSEINERAFYDAWLRRMASPTIPLPPAGEAR